MSRPLASDIAARIYDVSNQSDLLAELTAAIVEAIDTHVDDWEVEITQEDQSAILKALTGFVVSLGINLAAYPLGYTTAILFDENGDPVE